MKAIRRRLVGTIGFAGLLVAAASPVTFEMSGAIAARTKMDVELVEQVVMAQFLGGVLVFFSVATMLSNEQ